MAPPDASIPPDASTPSCVSGPPDNALWLRSFGAPLGAAFGLGVAVSQDGATYATGSFTGTVDFGLGTVTSELGDAYLVKLDASGGTAWVKRLAAAQGAHVELAPSGNIVVAGAFGGTLTLGDDVYVAGIGPDYYVAMLDPDGNVIWSQSTAGSGAIPHGDALGMDGAGNVVVAYGFPHEDYGGEVQVTKLDPEGTALWTSVAAADRWIGLGALAADADGSVVVTGDFVGTADFGGEPLFAPGLPTWNPPAAMFVWKLGPDGSHEWSKAFGNDTTQEAAIGAAVDVGADGAIHLTGGFASGIDFGGSTIDAGKFSRAFAAVLAPDGGYGWARTFGGMPVNANGAHGGRTVAADPAGNTSVAGIFNGSIDFEGAEYHNDQLFGTFTAFVVKLDAAGNHMWSHATCAGAGAEFGISAGSDGAVALTGTYWGTMNLGSLEQSSRGEGPDAFVVRFAP